MTQIGTNAAESAPSPKSLRNMLGTVHAVTKALQRSPVPKRLAQTMSRTMPRMRLAKMHSATVRAERTEAVEVCVSVCMSDESVQCKMQNGRS